MSKPRVLFFDIETSPIIAYVWGLYDQNIGLNQIHTDWHLLSWSAKWLGESKVMYMDQRNSKDVKDDKKILKEIWELIDQADILVTQNGKNFDERKLNARFVQHGMQPPSSSKHLDIFILAKNKFGFTSHKLEHMTNILDTKHKKQKHSNFEGMELWKECLAGNIKAWKEMEHYNRHDVLALEDLYHKVVAWDKSINFSVYTDKEQNVCKCGSKTFHSKGYHYTASGKFQRWKCQSCGNETRSRKNLFSKEKRASLRTA